MVKVLQKIVSAITKAISAVFGKSIGRFIGSILQAPINFLLNTAHYLGQGDFKGLLKYWGQVALQIALAVVVAIVAPYILGALFGILGAVLQGIGSFLGAIGGFLGNTVPLLGQVLGGALQFAGKALVSSGQFLSRIGTKLITQSKQLFYDLREQGLKGIFQSFKDRILEKINPITSYQNTWKSLTQGIHDLASRTGFSRFLGNVMEQVGVQIALQKIDKQLEKSKMSSFLKTLISTVSTAGIQALGSAVTDDIFPPQQAPAEATRTRAPPTGLSGVFTRIKDALSSVGGLVTDTLKDTAGFIQSIFVHDSGQLPPGARIDILQGPTQEIEFDSDHNPITLKILDPGQKEIRYTLQSLGDGNYRTDLGGGDWQFFRVDPTTKAILSQERIGNLDENASLIDWTKIHSASDIADQADFLLNASSKAAFDFFGPVGISPVSTQIFLAGEYAKGLIDTLRLGDQWEGIQSDFLQAQAFFQKGDYVNAAKSFGSAGLRGLTEAGRIANLLPLAGLATEGIGSGAQRARILANLAESQAARNASRFGLEGLNLAEEGFKLSKANALRLLESRGVDSARARNFINSFEGPLTVRRARPEEGFLRYARQPNELGNFLTKDLFRTPQDAIRELHMEQHSNLATFLQDVRSRVTPLVIEGQAKGSPSKIRQYLINPDVFEFRKGRRYYG